jgi:hypothetical protein
MNIKEFLFSKKVSELKMICKDSGIIGVSKLNKAGLVEIMSECELANMTEWYGLKPMIELSDIVPPTIIEEEEIILHLPLSVVEKSENHSEKWKEMFAKGKQILNK